MYTAVSEPGVQYQCDSCACDLTHTIRIKCADPVCQLDDGIDICPPCFCAGKEFGRHKRGHAYRVIVSSSSVLSLKLQEKNTCRKSIRIQFSLKIGELTSKFHIKC